MSRIVRVQGEGIRPPQVCVNCLEPATVQVRLRAQRALGSHRESREMQVPFCAKCHELHEGHTPFQRAVEAASKRMPFALAFMIVSGLVAFVFAVSGLVSSLNVLAQDRPAWPWYVTAVALAILAASSLVWYISKRQAEAPLPTAERAARTAVRIADFRYDVMDIHFGNDEYAERFQQENPGSSLVIDRLA